MIQIDMPMPTNCLDCPACNEYVMCAIPIDGRKWGENNVQEFGQGRPEWCPLKEQEPVLSHEDTDGVPHCGSCGWVQSWGCNYCDHCGKPLRWE